MWWLPACALVARTWDDVEEFPILVDADFVEPAPLDGTLRVLSYNIKFGGGRTDFFWDGWGDENRIEAAEVEANLGRVVDLLAEVDADIVLLQEVDEDSRRTSHVAQTSWLLERTPYNYAAWVPNWDVAWVPQEGLGEVTMGQTVLSKYEITRNTRIDQPQAEANSALVNWFYLHRAIQVTEVALPDVGPVTVVNVHPDAYSSDGTKKLHLEQIYDVASDVDGALVIGGDFNEVPPGTQELDDFADDSPNLDEGNGVSSVTYTEEETEWMRPFFETWNTETPLDLYEFADVATQSRFYTHSLTDTVLWTQKLDYLFGTFERAGGYVLQLPGDGDPPIASEPMAMSDHCPVVADWVLP
jgi:endonuclease/exonuclease/phosphatase family metal-dependent hydrolase